MWYLRRLNEFKKCGAHHSTTWQEEDRIVQELSLHMYGKYRKGKMCTRTHSTHAHEKGNIFTNHKTKVRCFIVFILFYFVLIFFRIEFNFVHIREECTSLRRIIYLRVIKTSFTADGGLNSLSLLFSSLFSCATLSNSDGESLVCMCTFVSSRINCNLSTPLKVSKPIL